MFEGGFNKDAALFSSCVTAVNTDESASGL